jgi:hypothetical protein
MRRSGWQRRIGLRESDGKYPIVGKMVSAFPLEYACSATEQKLFHAETNPFPFISMEMALILFTLVPIGLLGGGLRH